MRLWAGCFLLLCLSGTTRPPPLAQTATGSQKNGAELYRAACASCHGIDGRGAPRSLVGFDTPLPDFSDCGFASAEADADWMTVIHEGGSVRALNAMMPAFGAALEETEIERIIGHVRGFCDEDGWPRGDLNLPRPLLTEKAFPENEAVLTMTVTRDGRSAVGNEFLYERRVGRRGQFEVAVPFDLQETDGGEWARGWGDVAVAYKHVLFDSLARGSILSAGGEIVFPTGTEEEGFGNGTTIVEPFATFSQILPGNGFLHAHAGFELPLDGERPPVESFWRAAVGRTLVQGRWHRTWSPMVEILGSRALANGEPAMWDVVPQMQVSLSARQHVLLNAGLRVPINQREERGQALMVYLLWDWFDGGFFAGW
jgi:mono/diheme cytochrome c family protein